MASNLLADCWLASNLLADCWLAWLPHLLIPLIQAMVEPTMERVRYGDAGEFEWLMARAMVLAARAAQGEGDDVGGNSNLQNCVKMLSGLVRGFLEQANRFEHVLWVAISFSRIWCRAPHPWYHQGFK